ncbi:hypothetical protein ACFFRR_002122 [Megaselia abdita]
MDFKLQDITIEGRKCCLTNHYQKYLESDLKFPVKDDDLWIVTFPKCGSNWMVEVASLVKNNFEIQGASTKPLNEKYSHVEQIALRFPEGSPQMERFEAEIKNPKPNRILKSHLPLPFLPQEILTKKPKVIYVVRNVKDCVVSSYHFFTALGDFKGSLQEYVRKFIEGQVVFAPFWDHVLEFYERRNDENVFFVSYERMILDMESVLKELCLFFGTEIPDQEVLDQSIKHLSFKEMKESTSMIQLQEIVDRLKARFDTNKDFQFMRKGTIGSYKEELTESMIKDLDCWTKKALEYRNLTEDQILNFKKH